MNSIFRALSFPPNLLTIVISFFLSTAATAQILAPKDVEEFLDAAVNEAMKDSGVPGVLVTVVEGQKILLAKGYGVSDTEKKLPMDPQSTLFNVASIGKTMTAILAHELVANGQLELDKDVTEYIGQYGINFNPKRPTTLGHLLTHTGGFDAELSYLIIDEKSDPGMSDVHINNSMLQLRDPGSFASYSNLGFGLAGLIIQNEHNFPYAQIVNQNILKKFGMNRSVYGRPEYTKVAWPAECYVVRSKTDVPACNRITYAEAIQGAGGTYVTAHDMGRYMRVLLNNGVIDDRTVISSSAYKQLTDFDNYRFHEKMPGISAALFEMNISGHRAIVHGGNILGFSSGMFLFPDHNIGIFVGTLGGDATRGVANISGLISYLEDLNRSPETLSGLVMLGQLPTKFAVDMLPAPYSSSKKHESFSQTKTSPTSSFAGKYFSVTDLSANPLIKAFTRFQPLIVDSVRNGEVTVNGLGPFLEVVPAYFEFPDAGQSLAFKESEAGMVMAVNVSSASYIRLPWYADPQWMLLPIPLYFFIVFSMMFYAFKSGEKRKGAIIANAGMIVLILCSVTDLEYGPYLARVSGDSWLRVLLHIGQASGALLLVGASISLIRGIVTKHNPKSVLQRMSKIHIWSGALSAFALALSITAWWFLPPV